MLGEERGGAISVAERPKLTITIPRMPSELNQGMRQRRMAFTAAVACAMLSDDSGLPGVVMAGDEDEAPTSPAAALLSPSRPAGPGMDRMAEEMSEGSSAGSERSSAHHATASNLRMIPDTVPNLIVPVAVVPDPVVANNPAPNPNLVVPMVVPPEPNPHFGAVFFRVFRSCCCRGDPTAVAVAPRR